MRDSWLELVDYVLRPARPRLEPCLLERETHRAAARSAADGRMRAMAVLERQIEAERGAVFAANDGVVPPRMTELERQWRAVSHADPDGGLMDLWARIAPSSWTDRKRWRDSDAPLRLDAAIALASDVDGVEAAESAVDSLRAALAAWGTPIGPRIRWCAFDQETNCTTELLAAPQRTAREAVVARFADSPVLSRADQLEGTVLEAVSARFPGRPLLAGAIARAASVDYSLRAAALPDRPNPVSALVRLWRTGYALTAVDASGATLELPSL